MKNTLLYKVLFATAVLPFLMAFGEKDKNNSEQLYRNFASSIRNKGNLQQYLVVRIVDVNNNSVREFCTLGCFFRYALHKEWNLDFDKLSDDLVIAKAVMNSPRLFEFQNQEALDYLGTDLYTPAELAALQKQVDFKKLAKEILAAKKWEKNFGDDDKQLRLYAHALFNEGIPTGEDITAEGGKLIFAP